MVKASNLRVEDLGFESGLHLKIGTPVATLPCYRVSAGTDWPGVSILWVRWKVLPATSISVWQHVQLSLQIRPWDTLACGWDINPLLCAASENIHVGLRARRPKTSGCDHMGGNFRKTKLSKSKCLFFHFFFFQLYFNIHTMCNLATFALRHTQISLSGILRHFRPPSRHLLLNTHDTNMEFLQLSGPLHDIFLFFSKTKIFHSHPCDQ